MQEKYIKTLNKIKKRIKTLINNRKMLIFNVKSQYTSSRNKWYNINEKEGGKAMYSANIIAKELLRLSAQKGLSITNLHLQKMLYYTQGFSYACFNHPLFDDGLEAWKYGPVVPSVYNQYKQFVSSPIPYTENMSDCEVDGGTEKFLNLIVDKIGRKDPWALVSMTHNEKPWKEAYSPYYSREISKESMKDYFEGLINGRKYTE